MRDTDCHFFPGANPQDCRVVLSVRAAEILQRAETGDTIARALAAPTRGKRRVEHDRVQMRVLRRALGSAPKSKVGTLALPEVRQEQPRAGAAREADRQPSTCRTNRRRIGR